MDLKPCPFCGSVAALEHNKTWDYFVRCTNKQCASRTRNYHENDAGAVNAWNTRVNDMTDEQRSHLTRLAEEMVDVLTLSRGGVSE